MLKNKIVSFVPGKCPLRNGSLGNDVINNLLWYIYTHLTREGAADYKLNSEGSSNGECSIGLIFCISRGKYTNYQPYLLKLPTTSRGMTIYTYLYENEI